MGSSPYQMVLARVSRPRSLGEGVASVEQRISQFKKRVDYERDRKLKPEDSLIVPDILFKLQHHFGELEERQLHNPGFEGYYFFEVGQIIDFGLSRTGVILKSEVRLSATRAASAENHRSRYFHFDKPFLIYVRKRVDGSRPFFVMWVDNAELLKKWDG